MMIIVDFTELFYFALKILALIAFLLIAFYFSTKE